MTPEEFIEHHFPGLEKNPLHIPIAAISKGYAKHYHSEKMKEIDKDENYKRYAKFLNNAMEEMVNSKNHLRLQLAKAIEERDRLLTTLTKEG